ncbi:MAG: hypothetical protein G01um101470_1099 [Parcubacteria group bacterium Gr01-1014_70]|nr:MAG: hypothetical protein G01um101470_1099 [Parcubacteria group bacterium Gr01-1014_70]
MGELKRNDLVHPELSYKIIGCAFGVHNALGQGRQEKYYQRALAQEFRNKGLIFIEQVYYPVLFKEKQIGKNFLDFLVNNQVIVEIKKGDRYSKQHIDQVLEYLKVSDKQLAILINFGSQSVHFKRIINFNS